SFVLAARWLGFSDSEARQSLQALLAAYRTTQAQFADMSVLETWYAKIEFTELLQNPANDSQHLKRLKKTVEKARQHTAEHVFHQITTTTHGHPRIVDHPPLLYHPDPSEFDMQRDVMPFLETYRNTLSHERQTLFDRFQLVDGAYKVVGVGSVGTRCHILLFTGN